ncbi:MAG TPA: GNAT family N-acetyltransferase [Solirubrobacteraceae bacterium]|nr:GNAT family N-acetyltransferase [Solirubrobacteraceae bacterium]
MELVELQDVGEGQWRELIGEEREAWGGGPAEALTWSEKQRYVGVRSREGALLALAGSVQAEVEVERGGSFQVLGICAVFVTASARGRGLVARLLERLLAPAGAPAPAPAIAMLFCRAGLVGMYEKLGFAEIDAPVWADQPGGAVEMPLSAMWRPLRAGARWPAGRVRVRGLPF